MPCTTLQVTAAPPPPPPVKLSVTDIRVSPSEVTPGQTVTIEVTVRNTGGTTGSGTVVVTANVVEVDRFDTGPIGAGATEVFSIDWTPREVGTIRICAGVA